MALSRAQRKSLAAGFGVILVAAAFITLIWVGTYLPGFAGDVFSKVAGIMWTPVLLDITLFLLGIVLVLWLNSWVRAREGDEFVYLEQVDGPEIPADLPSDSRSAVFTDRPESQGIAPTLAAIEGALELADFGEAADLLFKLPPEELETPEVLALRIQLARRQGHNLKARELLECLRLKSPHHPLCSQADPANP